MNPRFLAVALWVIAALFLLAAAHDIRSAVQDRRPKVAGAVLLAVAVMDAVLANAGADLWLPASLRRILSANRGDGTNEEWRKTSSTGCGSIPAPSMAPSSSCWP